MDNSKKQKRSLTDIAEDLLLDKKKSQKFSLLWHEVRTIAGLGEQDEAKKISWFYTQLILDGRFVTLGENEWDLRSRHKFEKVHIDMNAIYAEEDEEEELIDEELEAEDGEYIEEKEEEDEEEEEEAVEEDVKIDSYDDGSSEY